MEVVSQMYDKQGSARVTSASTLLVFAQNGFLFGIPANNRLVPTHEASFASGTRAANLAVDASAAKASSKHCLLVGDGSSSDTTGCTLPSSETEFVQ